MNSSKLYHHGIKGLRWGVRRYQREDGTRTSTGKRRTRLSGYDSSAKKAAIKEYSEKFNKASHASDIADKKWTEVKAEYKALGKTRVTRMLNAARSKTDAAKKYNKDYNVASSMSDKADALWRESNKAYKKTGRNYVERVLNNIKYG